METRNLREGRTSMVTSNKMGKSTTVVIKRKERHPIYEEFANKTKKCHAHDEDSECNINDTVKIMEARPLSKTKRRGLVQIIEKAK